MCDTTLVPLQILISHVTGNVNSRQAALALAEACLLGECHTTLGCSVSGIWANLVPHSWRAFLSRRAFPEAVKPFLRLHPWREIVRQIWRRMRIKWPEWPGGIRAVAEGFDKDVAQSVSSGIPLRVVYSYMDAAEYTFRAAKSKGCVTFYELPTPYWRFTREVVIEEVRRQPAWAMTLPVLKDNDPIMQRRDRELQLADVILVPSQLVRDSLQWAPPFRGKVRVVSYGCPDPVSSPVSDAFSSAERPLRVLFVGSLNQGKGLAYLAAAMEELEQKAVLTIIGSHTSNQSCDALSHLLSKHRHLSGLTNEAVLAEMINHDVLVLPTLYEGLALVLLEAMACGLTVITTEHSGLQGMIEDGKEGFLVPLRDSMALRCRLRQLAADRELLAEMRSAAQAWSREHSWQRYRRELREVISEFAAS